MRIPQTLRRFQDLRKVDDHREGFLGSHSRCRDTLSHQKVLGGEGELKEAVREAGLSRLATCHTFHHSGVHPALCGTTHLLGDGADIQTVQELLGHKDVKTTMIYTQVLNRGGLGVRRSTSPNKVDTQA